MAKTEQHQSQSDTDGSLPLELLADDKRGGWITFPFITGNMLFLGIGTFGAFGNLIVYLIEKFNVKSIDATQINNIINGCSNLAPVAGAIISDSYFGCFSVISFSSFVSLLGMILLTLTATIHSLRPPLCTSGSQTCEPPSRTQVAILYSGITLVSIGLGGTRFTTATMGANQFNKPKDRNSFFNWFYFTLYVSFIAATTGIVYIQDNVGWGLGFGLCAASNAIGLAVFVVGRRYYHLNVPEGSPFMGLARVAIAAVRKRMEATSMDGKDYYHGHDELTKWPPTAPTTTLSFFNCAALKTEGDTHLDGTIAKPWRLCTVQQVEDMKTLIRIFPLWSTAIFVSTPIGILSSLTILQVLSMDRHFGPHFSIPASSFLVFVLFATAISLSLIDRFLFPMWRKLTGRYPTPLQRIGVGHIFNITSMALAALLESRRLHVVKSHNLVHQPTAMVPMSAMWLVPALVLMGIGEAFHFPGGVALYYQEFPTSLRSTSTAMMAVIIGIGFYLSTAVVDLVRKVTNWLPDNINEGRIDNVYWMLAVVGVVNYGYYLLCAWLYKYQNVDKGGTDSSSNS
ncbi:protein NRT1/ PTR FAMILY 2.7-like [Magnolia sinica]|uniref:protein NRT1/ PTR FAMILY 2.7-like n=1 Tax=Magnolia sinica TaxID=86752 RepID=UPI00265A0D9A|nr:protein NRT1/ PTR FAMILY 2.7-like [Magnolia sinica]